MEDQWITSTELRGKYFEFFTQRGHVCISAPSLVPENDPTALFITAGMQPLVPFLMGEKHPAGSSLVNVQKCFRTNDIDIIGNSTHLTFVEMLGNWSLGDYGKEEMIPWSWEFLTDALWLGIDPQQLYVTVFAGDEKVGKDKESIALWQTQYARAGIEAREGVRIFALGREDNWWGPVGQTGPCGPDTEMFFDTGQAKCSGGCQPGCKCGKYVEIWNDVFMEYERQSDGSYARLEQRNVDTGMGLARTLAVLNGLESVYEIDTMRPLIDELSRLSSHDYHGNRHSFRIIADHATAACHIIADGVVPANVEQGYVLRRLIRRCVLHARRLGIDGDMWYPLLNTVRGVYGKVYPLLDERVSAIGEMLVAEQQQFEQTLRQGMTKFDQLAGRVQSGKIEGRAAFDLYATYGFPLEMTQELAQERGLSVDVEGFEREFVCHQELSRQGAERKFTGGLADHSEMTKRYHTATHLLHAALRKVLGQHVEQCGSNITPDRLRFDFSHEGKVVSDQLRQAENLVNDAIAGDYRVQCEEVSLEQALQSGAIGLFGGKYGDRVKVYAVGDLAGRPDADRQAPTFSKEICGGPHVDRTGILGTFRIVKEQSASRGIRRIRAVLED